MGDLSSKYVDEIVDDQQLTSEDSSCLFDEGFSPSVREHITYESWTVGIGYAAESKGSP